MVSGSGGNAASQGSDRAEEATPGARHWRPPGPGAPPPPPGPPARAEPATSRTRGAVTAALRLIFSSVASARYGTLVAGLALARIEGPASLGVLAVAMVALPVIRNAGALGVSKAVAGWQPDPGEIAPSAMTIALAGGLAVAAGCYAGAPLLAAAMHVPAAATVVRLMSACAVLSGLAAVPRGVLQRRAPASLNLADQAGNWVTAAVMVGLAAAGFGPVSLAAGAIAGSAVTAGLAIGLAPRSVRIGWNRYEAPELLLAVLPGLASSLLLCVITSADLVVIGVLMRPRALGLYLLALCCASWPVTVLSQPVRAMTPAALARFRRSPKIAGSVFTSAARLLAHLTIPACVLIAILAEPLIHVAYGPVWAPATRVLVWLAPLAVLRAFYEVASDYYALIARALKELVFQATWLAALVPPLVLGAVLAGITGVAQAGLAVAAAVLCGWYLLELRPATLKLGRYSAGGHAILAMALGLIAFAALRQVRGYDGELIVGGILALGAVGVLVYRVRTVLRALQRAAAAPADIPASPGALISASVFELYPVLSAVPEAQAARALQPVAAPAGQNLGAKVRSGARWSMLNAIVMRVSGSVVSVFLARTVFGPKVWGLYAVSQVVLVLVLSANELGICAALIRWEGDVRSIARTVLTISVATSAVIYAGLYVAAPAIATALGSPGAVQVVRVLCICVIIDGFAGVPMTLLKRNFAQGRNMVVDSANFVVSTGITLWLAFSGYGAMSFAWGSVIGCTVATIAANVLAPGVWPGWSRGEAGRLLRFGLPLAGASLLTLGVFNVDSMIVGATLGPVMLGLYALAFNVSSWPLTVISQAASRVSFAGFSRVADSSQRLADAFTRALAVAMAMTVPACVLLTTLAEPLIHAVYGNKWIGAAPALMLLAMLGLLRVAYQLIYDCLAAAGQRHQLMWINALWLGTLIPALIAGARLDGIVGVGAGHLVVAACVVGPVFLWALTRSGITVRAVAGACLRPVAGGLLTAAASLAVVHFAGKGLLGVAAAAVAGMLVYAPVVFPMRTLVRSPAAPPVPAPLSQADTAA